MIPASADCQHLPQVWLEALARFSAGYELSEQKVRQVSMDITMAYADFDRRLRQM